MAACMPSLTQHNPQIYHPNDQCEENLQKMGRELHKGVTLMWKV